MSIKIVAKDAANALETMGAIFESRAEHIEACHRTLQGPQTTTAIEVWRLAAEMCRDADVIEHTYLVGSAAHISKLEKDVAEWQQSYERRVEMAMLREAELIKQVERLKAANASLVRSRNEARNANNEQFERMRKHNDVLIEERNTAREKVTGYDYENNRLRRDCNQVIVERDNLRATNYELTQKLEEAKNLLAKADELLSADCADNEETLSVPYVTSKVVFDVLNERLRQISVKGYDAAHDLQHGHSTLSDSAVAYLSMASTGDYHLASAHWQLSGFKPASKPRDNLVKGCAMILAEIEMIDRREAGQ